MNKQTATKNRHATLIITCWKLTLRVAVRVPNGKTA